VAAVERGESITLVIGGTPAPGAYYAATVDGVASGTYECRTENGVPTMRQRIQAAFPRFTLSNCGPGGCPQPVFTPRFR